MRTVELLLRHVDIVDEDQALGAALDAPNLLALPHELAFDIGLRAFTLRLGREVQLDWHDWHLVLSAKLGDELLHDHRFTGTRGSRDEDRLIDLGGNLEQSHHFLGVNCRYD